MLSNIFYLPLASQSNNIFYWFDHMNDKPKEKIYVIGNGWASYHFVKNLDKRKFNPIIIAPNQKVLDTTKLRNRIFDKEAIVEFSNKYADFVQDELEDINIENKMLITKSGNKYKYNKVVLGIGSESNDYNISGINEYTYKFKSIKDVDIIRDKLSSDFINKKIYIIGTGVTGIEIASKLGLSYNIQMIEGLDSILPGYSNKTKSLIFNYMCNQKNIKIDLNNLVKSIDDKTINIKTNNKDLSYFYDKKNDIIIWTGGVRFNGFEKTKLFNTLSKITTIKERGIEVNDDFTIGSENNIYCLGDMVSNKGNPSAQNARIQGEWLAKYFNNNFNKKYLEKNKFESKSSGKLIHLNDNLYLESEYYSGYIPNFIEKIFDFLIK